MSMTNSYTNFIFIVFCSVFKTWSAVSLSYFHIFRKNYFAISFEIFFFPGFMVQFHSNVHSF